PEWNLVAFEEASELCAGGVVATAEDDCSDRHRRGCTGLQTSRPGYSAVRQEANSLRDLRRGGDEHLIVAQLDSEHARALRCAESARVEHSERDRHLGEDVTRSPLADHARHAVDEPEHLEATLEDAEERPLV